MNIGTLKERFLNSIDLWLEERVGDMLKGNPAMAIPSVYIKRGCHNIIKRYKKNIGDGMDIAALFFADDDNNIDANTLFTDGMNLLKQMEETSFDLGIMEGTMGKGKVSLTLPDNILTNLIFGNKKTLTFNEDDLLELKALLLTE